MNNIDNLIKYLVPFSFLAIWAITSLLNRETKPAPARRPIGDRPGSLGNRPGEPTLRWGAPNSSGSSARDRRTTLGTDDDIVILSSDDARLSRPPRPKPNPPATTRRTARTRPQSRPARVPQAAPTPSLVSGVNQSINQQLATSIDLAPLPSIDRNLAAETIPAGLPPPPSAAPVPGVRLAALLTDPERVREALLIREILGPPVSLRPRADRRG